MSQTYDFDTARKAAREFYEKRTSEKTKCVFKNTRTAARVGVYVGTAAAVCIVIGSAASAVTRVFTD